MTPPADAAHEEQDDRQDLPHELARARSAGTPSRDTCSRSTAVMIDEHEAADPDDEEETEEAEPITA